MFDFIKHRRARRANRGFSFIELIISIVFISVAFVAFAAAAGTWLLNQNTKDQEIALRVARTEMEFLHAHTYSALPVSGSFSNPLLGSLKNGQGSLTVTTVNSKTKQVMVVVSWTEPNDGNTHSVSLTSLFTQGGL